MVAATFKGTVARGSRRLTVTVGGLVLCDVDPRTLWTRFTDPTDEEAQQVLAGVTFDEVELD